MAKNSPDIFIGIVDFIKSRFIRFETVEPEKSSLHKFSKKKSKTYLTKNETLKLDTQAQLKIIEVNNKAKALFKELITKPEELIKYIESNGTLVIRAPHVEKVLMLIGEQEGFILPLKGARAYFLTFMLNILSPVKLNVSSESPPMFVMRNRPANIYYLAHQFHHWISYINGLPGYDFETNDNFKYIFNSNFNDNDIRAMSIDEILSLKDAIARDVEAIKFVKEISRELIGQKLSSKRLQNGESLNI